MLKSELLAFVRHYHKTSWAFDPNVRILLLEFFLELPEIRDLPPNANLTFDDFREGIMEILIRSNSDDNFDSLFDEKYLKGKNRSAEYFRVFFQDRTLVTEEKEPPPKNLTKFSLPVKPTPDKTVIFFQSSITAQIESVFKSEQKKLDKKGVCSALVLKWYDFRRNNKNLIEWLEENPEDSMIIKTIRILQENVEKVLSGGGTEIFKLNFSNVQEQINLLRELAIGDDKFKEKIKKENEDDNKNISEEVIFPIAKPKAGGLIHGYMSFLDAEEALLHSLFLNDFPEYFNNLQKSNRHLSGLHTLLGVGLYGEVNIGHIIGWTYTNDYFVLFDPNRGEFYFKDFNKFKDFVWNYVSDFDGVYKDALGMGYQIADFYSPEEVKKFKEASALKISSLFKSEQKNEKDTKSPTANTAPTNVPKK